MKNLTEYLIKSIVDNPQEVEVSEQHTDANVITLTIRASNLDIGKIIGKQGRTIRALRDLVKIVAVKQNKYVDITIAE